MAGWKDKLKDAGAKAAEKAGEMKELGADKVSEILEDYRTAVATLESFGFRVGKFRVGMGVLPEINTTILGSIQAVDEDELREMLEKHEEKKVLVACIGALLTAKDFQRRADLLQFSEITLELKLGIPPKVSFDLNEPSG